MSRRLLTIPISHYCEKARWALDRAGLEYREERHVQGVSRAMARRAGGTGTMPVLVDDDGVLAESEQIVRYADEHLDEPRRLFPDDPELRTEVEQLSRWLDQGLGPDGRRLIYAHMLGHKDLMLRFNNQGVPAWEARGMRLLWPLAKRWAVRELGLTPTTIADDGARVRRAFDAIAERLADGRRHLCGDRFTAADLTFASLAASVIVPAVYGVTLPQPDVLPPAVAADVERFREHPAGAYALRLIRDHRS
jgi:glutathione S-transferase